MRKMVGAHAAVETGASTGFATTVLALLSASALASFGLVSAHELSPSPFARARAGSESVPLQPPAGVVVTPRPTTGDGGDPGNSTSARTGNDGGAPLLGAGIIGLPISPALQPAPGPGSSDGSGGNPPATEAPAPAPAPGPAPAPDLAPAPGPVVVALPVATLPTGEVAPPIGAAFSTQPAEAVASVTKVLGTKQKSGRVDSSRDDSPDRGSAIALHIVDQQGERTSDTSDRDRRAPDLRERSRHKKGSSASRNTSSASKSESASSQSRSVITWGTERTSDQANSKRDTTAARTGNTQDNGHRRDRANRDANRDGRSDRRDHADPRVDKSRGNGSDKSRGNGSRAAEMPGNPGAAQLPGNIFGAGAQPPGNDGSGDQHGDHADQHRDGDGRGDQDRDGRGDQDRDGDGHDAGHGD